MGANEARAEALSQLHEYVTTHTSDAAKNHRSELSLSRQVNKEHMHNVIHVMALARHGKNAKQMEVLNSFKSLSATATAVVHGKQAAFLAFCGNCGSKRNGNSLAKICCNCGCKFEFDSDQDEV